MCGRPDEASTRPREPPYLHRLSRLPARGSPPVARRRDGTFRGRRREEARAWLLDLGVRTRALVSGGPPMRSPIATTRAADLSMSRRGPRVFLARTRAVRRSLARARTTARHDAAPDARSAEALCWLTSTQTAERDRLVLLGRRPRPCDLMTIRAFRESPSPDGEATASRNYRLGGRPAYVGPPPRRAWSRGAHHPLATVLSPSRGGCRRPHARRCLQLDPRR